MRFILVLATSFALAACGTNQNAVSDTNTAEQSTAKLAAVLASQPDEAKARFAFRNPGKTLTFFGIEPGMTVVEALPGGGWYSKILLPYLGDEGALIGANYAVDMQRLFGFYSEEQLKKAETWTTDWPQRAQAWTGSTKPKISAFALGAMPDAMAGSADAVVLIRALHNLARFEPQGGYLSQALSDAYTVLKPGGVLGVVQHQMPEDRPDSWANGNRGYLKQSFVIARLEEAGFVFEEASSINANAKDQPQDGDVVWRLPPTLSGSKNNPEAAAAMQAIGETNRMTLRFRKPVTQ